MSASAASASVPLIVFFNASITLMTNSPNQRPPRTRPAELGSAMQAERVFARALLAYIRANSPLREDCPMMTPRQEAFRADYRGRISPWYSGLAHVVVIAFIGILTIWYAAGH